MNPLDIIKDYLNPSNYKGFLNGISGFFGDITDPSKYQFPVMASDNANQIHPTTPAPKLVVASQQQPSPTPTSAPGQDDWVKMMMAKGSPGASPDYYKGLYNQAVNAPGGHAYTTPTPTPTPGPFTGFTTAQVPNQYADLIAQAAQKAGIHPAVLASLLFSESGIRPDARNDNRDQLGNIIPGNYDRGMGQINSIAHPDVTDAQAYDPNFAVPFSANLLARYIKQAGDINHGIAAYNVGVGGASNPDVYNTKGKAYLKKVAAGLSPDIKKQLGIQE